MFGFFGWFSKQIAAATLAGVQDGLAQAQDAQVLAGLKVTVTEPAAIAGPSAEPETVAAPSNGRHKRKEAAA